MKGAWPSCLVAASAVLLFAAAAPAHAQVEAHLGKTVVAIRLQIEDRPEESEQLRALIDIKVGQPLRAEDIRSTQVHFASIPRFEDVQVDVAEAPGGVSVTVRLIPRHPVDRIDIEGETGLDTGELRELLLNRYGRLLPTAERTAEVEETVRRILVDEGFPKASVTAKQVLRHDPDRATLLINVVAGPRALISRTTVTGTSPFSSAQIIERTETAQGMPYRQRALVTELADIRDELRSRNYYAAVATHTSRPTPEGVEVAINVDAGSPVEIRTEPPGALPQRDVEALIRREGSVDQDIIEQTQEDLTARLRRDGYWKATVTARREARDGVQVIVFGVDRGLRYRIDRIAIPQDLALPPAEIDKLMNLKSGQLFDQRVVETGINRVLIELWRRGFYRAVAKPVYKETSRPGQSDEAGVIVTPGIDQGPLGKVVDIQFQYAGEHRLSESLLRAVMRSKVGEAYNLANRLLDMDAMTTVYENQGFLNATIEVTPRFSEDGRDVTVVVNVAEGPQFVIADIAVIGNERVSREAILEEITLRPGQPFSRAEQLESQRRLFDMGVFRRVRIEDPRLASETDAHVVISVEETPRHTLGGGGGLEAERLTRRSADGGVEDYLEVSPRAFFEIGRRNLGGRNRAINFFSRVSLGQRNVSRDPEDEGRGYGFSEYRATVTYRERRAFRSDTDLLVGVTSEQARRTSFNFIRQSITAEAAHALDRLRRVTVSGRYDLNFTRLFDNIIEPDDERNLLIDRLFPQVRLSTLSAGVIWDRRQPDPLSPSRGNLIGGDLEFAVRALGSEVGYAKLFFQISQFHALTTNRRFVLAGRAQLGLARGFEREVPETGDVIADLPASQRFFAGGGTSVRGFQLDRLAVPEVLNKDGLSVGGNALVVLNGEIRTIAGRLFNRQVGVVAFLDGGNVFARVGDLDFGQLRGAAGFGVRYDSPIGPVRLDIGFKLNRLLINGRRERGWEYHLSIGEAF